MTLDDQRENPRTTRVRQVALDAAVGLLLSGGTDEVTAAKIAVEADLARTTIYRHWPDRSSLLLATIDHLIEPHGPAPDSGDFAADFERTLSNLCNRLTMKKVRPIFAALADRASHDETFAAAQRRFVLGLLDQTIAVIDRAKMAGELPSDVDGVELANRLAGPMLYRWLVILEPIGQADVDEAAAGFRAVLS
ncbi:MAG: TetR/AcrR family transcriptional regulator [Actinomycetota bacterium]